MTAANVPAGEAPLGDLVAPEPEERPDLWPFTARRGVNGALSIGGRTLIEILSQAPTPVFVLDEADLRGRAAAWTAAMAEEFCPDYGMNGGEAFYAGKAFLTTRVARTVLEQGMGIDSASRGELAVALAALGSADGGRSPARTARLGLHGNGKTRAEIAVALHHRLGHLVLDSVEEIALAADVVRDLREALAAAGDPARAEQQRRYLKSAMEMYGVGVPRTRRIAQAAAASHPSLWRDATGWEAALRRVWDTAEHREERFAVLAIIRSRHCAQHAERIESLALYEHLLRTGQWWDLVDEASHAVGLVVRAHPAAAARMRAWATDADLWVRRSAIICQLQHKDRTDPGLLSDVIEANQEDPEFFIRKAIGWALRDYARTAPVWVRRFVDSHPRLSPLSRREALKHL